MRVQRWLLLLAAGLATVACDRGRLERTKVPADAAIAITVLYPNAVVDANVVDARPEVAIAERAREMCAALSARSASARDFVRLPLRWRARVGGDACSSGDVPCGYVTRSIHRLDELTCAGWQGLDPAERYDAALDSHITIKGKQAVIESGVGQFALFLVFERSSEGYVLVAISDDMPPGA